MMSFQWDPVQARFIIVFAHETLEVQGYSGDVYLDYPYCKVIGSEKVGGRSELERLLHLKSARQKVSNE